jgi:hypothetical protein
VTVRVGCVVCRGLREVDLAALGGRESWPRCCGRPMLARCLRAVRLKRKEAKP